MKALKTHFRSSEMSRAWILSMQHMIQTIPLFLKIEEEKLLSHPELLITVSCLKSMTPEKTVQYVWMEALEELLQGPDTKIAHGFTLLRSAFFQLAELKKEHPFEFYCSLSGLIYDIMKAMNRSIPSSVEITLNEEKTSVRSRFFV